MLGVRKSGQDLVIFNQFDEFGNYLWHHEITGPAMMSRYSRTSWEVLKIPIPGDYFGHRFRRHHCLRRLSQKKLSPLSKIAAVEALQCPTLLQNGFGAHRIEGIGDKHVPWIHNTKNTDMVIAMDDEFPISLIRTVQRIGR